MVQMLCRIILLRTVVYSMMYFCGFLQGLWVGLAGHGFTMVFYPCVRIPCLTPVSWGFFGQPVGAIVKQYTGFFTVQRELCTVSPHMESMS